MTDLEILSALKKNACGMLWSELLNEHSTDPATDEKRLKSLLEDKKIEGTLSPYGMIRISDNGLLYLQDAAQHKAEEERRRQDEAKRCAQQRRHDLRMTIFGALIAGACGFAFDLLMWFIKHS